MTAASGRASEPPSAIRGRGAAIAALRSRGYHLVARRLSKWLLPALPLLVMPVSCADDELPVLPGRSGLRGAIQGHVRVAGEGARMRLFLDRRYPGEYLHVETESSSDGAFAILVPAGDYEMSIESTEGSLRGRYWYSRSGPVYLSRDSDPIRVPADSAAVPVDLDFGAIDLRLKLPPSVDPAVTYLQLWSRNPSTPVGVVDPRWMEIIDDGLSGRVAPLPAGTYSVLCRQLGVNVDLWLPGMVRREEADSILVGTDAIVSYECVFAARMGRFSGSVTGAWQWLDVRPPGIWAFDADSIFVGSTEASSSGEFELTTAGADSVRFLVLVEGAKRWMGGADFSDATVFPVDGDQEMLLPPIEDGGFLVRIAGAGSVERRDLVYRVIDRAGRIVATGVERTAGDVLPIAGLAPGEYRLQLEPEEFGLQSWIGQWFDRAPTSERAAVIHVPEGGQVVPLTVTLEPGGMIRGRVVRTEPWWGSVGFSLTLADLDACVAVVRPNVSSAGDYEIRGVPEGAYKLAAGPGLAWSLPCGSDLLDGWIWYGQTASWDSATVIAVRDGETVEGIDLELPPQDPGVLPRPPGGEEGGPPERAAPAQTGPRPPPVAG